MNEYYDVIDKHLKNEFLFFFSEKSSMTSCDEKCELCSFLIWAYLEKPENIFQRYKSLGLKTRMNKAARIDLISSKKKAKENCKNNHEEMIKEVKKSNRDKNRKDIREFMEKYKEEDEDIIYEIDEIDYKKEYENLVKKYEKLKIEYEEMVKIKIVNLQSWKK